MRKYRVFTILFLLAAVGIFYFSSMPTIMKKLPFPMFDKILHIIAFIIFAFLASGALWENRITKHIVFWAIVLSAFYGATDEIHQLYVQGRQCSIYDWIADIVGAIIGVLIARNLPFFRRLGSSD